MTVKRGKPAEPEVFYYINAVEEVLCFGWVDSTHKKINGIRMQRFASRKKTARVQSLTKSESVDWKSWD